MKKLLSVVLIVVMCFAISSCTMTESMVVGTDGKIKVISKVSLSETEAELIKENAKNSIGTKINLDGESEILDEETAQVVIDYVDAFTKDSKTEEIEGETYYYTETIDSLTIKEFNKQSNWFNTKGNLTATDYWIYDKDGNMQETYKAEGIEEYIFFLTTFGGTFDFVTTMKMPFKITETNFEKIDDYTVDLLKPGDPKFAYIITEESHSDWTKSETLYDEIVKMARAKYAKSTLYSPYATFKNESKVQLSWAEDSSFDKVEVQRKVGSGRWQTVKTIKSGVCYYNVTNIKANKVYYFRIRGIVEHKDLGKVYGVVSKERKVDTTVLNAPSVKLVKGKKSFTVKATKKHKGVPNFQIKYSLKKSMKSYKTKTKASLPITVKKLKSGKTYYVQVRKVFYNDNYKKYYGNWSKVKKVTVK